MSTVPGGGRKEEKTLVDLIGHNGPSGSIERNTSVLLLRPFVRSVSDDLFFEVERLRHF
jgi:hypothetical protein